MTAGPHPHPWRHRAFLLLESHGGHPWVRRLIDGLIVVLVVLNTVAVVVGSVPAVHARWGDALFVFESVSIALFTVEYAARLWAAPEHPEWSALRPWRARWRWASSPMAIVDLVAILPFFVLLAGESDLAFLRLLRLFRIFKLMRYSQGLQSLWAAIRAERRSFAGALLIATVILLFAATIMHLIEKDAQPDRFGTLPDGLWWAVVTLATLGYGDVVPATALGKVFAGFCALLGLCLFTLPAFILANAFANEIKRRDFVVSVRLVSRVPLFAAIDVNNLVAIATLLRPRSVPSLATVCREGDPAEAMYFVLDGELELRLPNGPVRLGPGEFFGELGLLRGGRRMVTCVAVSDCQLLILHEADFNTVLDRHPQLRAAIEKIAADRTRAMAQGAPPPDPDLVVDDAV